VPRSLPSLAPLLLIAVLALSSSALAGNPVRLAYEAPEACPAQPAFVAAVAARGGDFAGAQSTGSRRVMVVAIRKEEHGFAGAFQVRDDETASNKREVHGQSCGDVVDALAVVTAIALRSESADVAADAAPGANVTPRAAPPAVPAARAETPVGAPPEERLRGSTRALPPRTEKVQVGAGTLRFDVQRSYTLSVGAAVGLVPSVVLPRYDLSMVLANFVTTPEGAQRIAGPVVQVRLSGFGPATYRSANTTTDLSGISFGFGLCQSPHYDTRGLVLLFCGEYGGGLMRLVSRGADGSQIQAKNAGYGTVTFGADLQYNIGAIFNVAAKVGGGFNVGDVTAERADGSQIFKSSLLSAYGLLGVGLHF
jgi:hypothetical protein